MTKDIFDEANETLLGVGTTFIAVPCNPIGLENSDMIHLRNATTDYESEMSKVEKALKLGKLYKELSNYVDEQTYAHKLPEITTLKIKIKVLENDENGGIVE
ncbi:MAG: hypothetical protein PHC31_05515 [Clostridia bacterium]|nr:hypothetical protein [Clostridia bacterium]MDD3971358.1 hypothetical protein [Clostridia bacterium]